MSKTPRTDELYKKYRGKTSSPDELMEYIELCEKLETELDDMREMFREYVKAEDAWRENFKWAHDIHAARLRKKAKEVLGL